MSALYGIHSRFCQYPSGECTPLSAALASQKSPLNKLRHSLRFKPDTFFAVFGQGGDCYALEGVPKSGRKLRLVARHSDRALIVDNRMEFPTWGHPEGSKPIVSCASYFKTPVKSSVHTVLDRHG